MTRVLVTGGTGSIGRETVAALRDAGATVRVLSRGPARDAPADVEWAVADYLTGQGLAKALSGVDVVVHAAHDGARYRRGDQEGLARLLAAVDAAGRPHFVYVSIVGTRDMPGIAYYAAKARAEDLVRADGRPASIFRATQFHGFLDDLLGAFDRLPVAPLPRGLRFQPVSVEEAGAALARHALAPSPIAEIAGPEVRDLADLLRARDAARGVRRPLWTLPVPLPVTRAMAAGHLTSPTAERGRVTWDTWQARRHGADRPEGVRREAGPTV